MQTAPKAAPPIGGALFGWNLRTDIGAGNLREPPHLTVLKRSGSLIVPALYPRTINGQILSPDRSRLMHPWLML
jgi:hypothetical protein